MRGYKAGINAVNSPELESSALRWQLTQCQRGPPPLILRSEPILVSSGLVPRGRLKELS